MVGIPKPERWNFNMNQYPSERGNAKRERRLKANAKIREEQMIRAKTLIDKGFSEKQAYSQFGCLAHD